MRICCYDGNLEILRAAFSELFDYYEITEDMWKKIVELGQAKTIPDLINGLYSYDRVRAVCEEAKGDMGLDEEFFAGDRWFASGVSSLETVGCLIGDDVYCLVKGYDRFYDLYTVSYLRESDISEHTVPAITDKSGDFVVGVPGLVGTYKYAVLIMKK